MNVRELIKELQKIKNKNLQVCCTGWNDYHNEHFADMEIRVVKEMKEGVRLCSDIPSRPQGVSDESIAVGYPHGPDG